MLKSLRQSLSLVLAAILALGVFSLPVLAADDPAAGGQVEAGQYSTTPSDGQGGGALTDSNRASSLKLAAGTEVAIASSVPFDRLYLVWDLPPGAHEFAVGGGTVAGGGYGFLHEYVELGEFTTEATLRLAEGEYTLCDIYLFAGDDLPDFVQVWQPPLERADLLALSTHADDEHLFFGGTLPTYAGERGMAVQVVYMTSHWGEPYRPHELLNGLWEVGVTAYPVIGPFPDLYESLASLESAEGVYPRDEVRAFQVEMLRRFKPHVVIGHDINGEYGHGAHILNAQTLLEALPLAPDETAYPESAAAWGTWEVPKVYLHLWGENQITMDWNVPLEHFGGRTAFEMAEAGFARHVSQVDYFTVQQGGTWEDCRLFGLAHTTVGPDVAGGDFFENIDLTPEPAPEPVASVPPVAETPTDPPADPVAPDEADDGFPVVLLVLIIAIVAVVAVVVIAIVIERNRRRRRRTARRARQPGPDKQDGRVTYRRK